MKFFNTLSLTTIAFSLFVLISTQQTNALWPFTSDVCQRIRDRSNLTLPYIPNDLEKEGDREYCEELLNKNFPELEKKLEASVKRVSDKSKKDRLRLDQALDNLFAICGKKQGCKDAGLQVVAMLKVLQEGVQEAICLDKNTPLINSIKDKINNLLDNGISSEKPHHTQEERTDVVPTTTDTEDDSKEEISLSDRIKAVQEQNKRIAQIREQRK